MRMLAISDVHGDARLYGVPRYDEIEEVMEQSVRVAVERRVDHYLFDGDLSDVDSGIGLLRCICLALRTARALNEEGIPSTWVSGNHDVFEDGSGETSLSPLRDVGGGVQVFDRPGWRRVSPDTHMLVLPYTALSHTYDPEEFVESSNWPDTRAAGPYSSPIRERVIVAGHLAIEGVQPGEETKDMPRGRDVLWPTKALAKKRNVALQIAGHYHRRQKHGDIQIVGAPARFAFGEKGNEPAFMVVEV